MATTVRTLQQNITMLHCAILDDYQNCALGFADWSALDGVEVKNFTDAITTPDALAEQLGGFEIIVAMRERTRFNAALFARLPRLKLLVTTGMRNAAIDLEAAAARGLTVCGTRGLSDPNSGAHLGPAPRVGAPHSSRCRLCPCRGEMADPDRCRTVQQNAGGRRLGHDWQ